METFIFEPLPGNEDRDGNDREIHLHYLTKLLIGHDYFRVYQSFPIGWRRVLLYLYTITLRRGGGILPLPTFGNERETQHAYVIRELKWAEKDRRPPNCRDMSGPNSQSVLREVVLDGDSAESVTKREVVLVSKNPHIMKHGLHNVF